MQAQANTETIFSRDLLAQLSEVMVGLEHTAQWADTFKHEKAQEWTKSALDYISRLQDALRPSQQSAEEVDRRWRNVLRDHSTHVSAKLAMADAVRAFTAWCPTMCEDDIVRAIQLRQQLSALGKQAQ